MSNIFNEFAAINLFGALCRQGCQCVHVYQLTSWSDVNVNAQLLPFFLLQVLALQPGQSQLPYSSPQVYARRIATQLYLKRLNSSPMLNVNSSLAQW